MLAKPAASARARRWAVMALAGLGAVIGLSAVVQLASDHVPATARLSLFLLELVSGATLAGAWHERLGRPIDRQEKAPAATA
jgi:hypothetical protein